MLAAHQAWINYLWHDRFRCIYAVVPKAGTSSVKRWFVATHPGSCDAAAGRNLHDFVREHYAMNLLEPQEAAGRLGDPNVFRFSFVRNPWSRLVSGFLDKVVGVQPVARPTIRRHYHRSLATWTNWKFRRLTGSVDRLFERGITFRQFVESLTLEKPQDVNPHFRLQSLILKGIPLDFIGRIENFAANFALVQQRLGDATPAVAEHRQNYATETSDEFVADWSPAQLRSLAAFPRWRRFYPPDVAELVRRLYADDFAAYGYSTELLNASRLASRTSPLAA